MKIALVNPITRRSQGYHTIGRYIPQLGLSVLANRVRDHHSVDIIDEVFGQEQTARRLTRENYDLVGITGYTSSAPRAYEIAALCRERGLPTVMGGPHASVCPDEAQPRFNAVAVGECDECWPGIVTDAENGKLAARYEGKLADLSAGLGGAAQDLQPVNGKYEISCIQTSRGCPVGCDYCSVTRFNGSVVRRRPIDDIVDEWNRCTKSFAFVVDDNFFGLSNNDIAWARELLTELIRRGRKRLWFSQTTMNMGQDVDSLRLAYKAGCRGMLVGFESFNPATLKAYRKGINTKLLDRYKQMVDGFHKAGVAVFGGFIVGADEDTPDTVADTTLQAVQLGVDIIQVTNLTLLPGTRMYDRYLADGRMQATNYPEDWERYSFAETVYRPAKMTSRELDQAVFEIRKAAAGSAWVWKRTLKSLWRNRSLTTALFVHGMNQGWARMARAQMATDESHYAPPTGGERAEKIRRAFAFFHGAAANASNDAQTQGRGDAEKAQGS